MINMAPIVLNLINASRRPTASKRQPNPNYKHPASVANRDILDGRGLKPLGHTNIPMSPVKPSVKHNIHIKMTYDNVWHIYVNNKLTFSTTSNKNLLKHLATIINNKN